MKDRLEEHIVKNRDLLDVYDDPGDLLWQRIDRELRPQRSWLRATTKWAATLLVLATAAYWGAAEWGGALSTKGVTADLVENSAFEQEEIAPELTQIETYYISVINTQKEQLQKFKEEGIVLDPELTANIDRLQEMYGDLRKELAYGEDKEMVIEAMVKNLMTQMEILQQQLRILEQIKKAKNEREIQV